MELGEVLRSIRVKRHLVVIGLALGLALGAALGLTSTPMYRSTMQLFVSVADLPASASTPTDPAASAFQNDAFSQARVVSYVQVLTGEPLAQQVVDQLRLPVTAHQLAAEVTANPLPGTVIIEVAVTDPSPRQAQAIAQALGQNFVQRVSSLETSPGSSTPMVKVDTLQHPDLDLTPVSPNVTLDIALGGALGLLLGLALALVRGRTDTSVRSRADLGRAVGVDVVGVLAEDRELARKRTAAVDVITAPHHRAMGIDVAQLGSIPPQVIAVTSPLPGEGKSVTAARLAFSLARAGKRVCLIDANLYRPRLARYLGLVEGPGLTDVLTGRAELREAAQHLEGLPLTVLGAGPLPPDPADLFGSVPMRALLKILRDTQDHVVLDAPPVLPVADAAALASLSDGCLLVARYGKSRRDELAEAAAVVREARGRLVGAVLNRAPRSSAVAAADRHRYGADPERRELTLSSLYDDDVTTEPEAQQSPVGPILSLRLPKSGEL